MMSDDQRSRGRIKFNLRIKHTDGPSTARQFRSRVQTRGGSSHHYHFPVFLLCLKGFSGIAHASRSFYSFEPGTLADSCAFSSYFCNPLPKANTLERRSSGLQV